MDLAEYKDLPKKYVGTFIQYSEKGSNEKFTLYVESFEAHDEEEYSFQIYGKTIDKEYVTLSSNQYDFDFSFPPIGVLSYKNTVVIASKYPARQWKKAATGENYKVWLPLQPIFNKLSGVFIIPRSINKEINWTVEDVHEWFSSKTVPFKEAIDLLKNNKKIAVALSEQFFITSSHYGQGYLIWRYNKIVAEVDHSLNLTIISKAFEQEIKDYFDRSEDA